MDFDVNRGSYFGVIDDQKIYFFAVLGRDMSLRDMALRVWQCHVLVSTSFWESLGDAAHFPVEYEHFSSTF